MPVHVSSLELGEHVERSPSGVPTAWRIFAPGANPLTLQGTDAVLTLDEPKLQSIADYAARKGNKIPVDSQHFLSSLATKLKRDEADLLKMLPAGTATMGFGELAMRSDGLWFQNVQFVPLAEELLKAGTIKYFSPVLRGVDGSEPLRVTSVALSNEPQLNHLPELTRTLTLAEITECIQQLERTIQMPEKDKPELEIAVKRDKVLCEVLQLAETDTPEAVRGKLIALKTQADLVPGLNAKISNLELAEKTRKDADEKVAKEGILRQLLADGQLTNAMAETGYFQKMSSVELAEYGKATPKNSFVNTAPAAPRGREGGEELSPIMKNVGVTLDEFKKSKGGC